MTRLRSDSNDDHFGGADLPDQSGGDLDHRDENDNPFRAPTTDDLRQHREFDKPKARAMLGASMIFLFVATILLTLPFVGATFAAFGTIAALRSMSYRPSSTPVLFLILNLLIAVAGIVLAVLFVASRR